MKMGFEIENGNENWNWKWGLGLGDWDLGDWKVLLVMFHFINQTTPTNENMTITYLFLWVGIWTSHPTWPHCYDLKTSVARIVLVVVLHSPLSRLFCNSVRVGIFLSVYLFLPPQISWLWNRTTYYHSSWIEQYTAPLLNQPYLLYNTLYKKSRVLK